MGHPQSRQLSILTPTITSCACKIQNLELSCPQTNPSHSPLDYRFAGSKTVHLHPPSSHHNCHPWSHSPNAATTITRSLLMQSSLKLTAELQHVGPLIRSMCVIRRITCTAVRVVHALCRRATSASFQRAGGTRSPIPPSLP